MLEDAEDLGAPEGGSPFDPNGARSLVPSGQVLPVPPAAPRPIIGVDAFGLAIDFILRKDIEGGWYAGTSKIDPNPTNMGITLATWRRQKYVEADVDNDGDVDATDLRKATRGHVIPVYRHEYWLLARCHEMPPPVAVAVFDTAVNCGVGGAALIVQDALGIPEGDQAPRFGPLTMAGIARWDPLELAREIIWERLNYYADIVALKPSKAPAMRHWVYRCNELWRYVERAVIR